MAAVTFDSHVPCTSSTETGAAWQISSVAVTGDDWTAGDPVSVIVAAHEVDGGFDRHRVIGTVVADGDRLRVDWERFESRVRPAIVGDGFYRTYVGATLTAKAFDSVADGTGKWLVTIAAWLFAISTMIAWSYYGEQAVVFLGGERFVLPYKLLYCALIVLATLGFVRTAADLDNVIGIGTGVMMFSNLPICWLFGYQAMRAYKDYVARLRSGRMGPDHPPPHLDELLSGRDVEKR